MSRLPGSFSASGRRASRQRYTRARINLDLGRIPSRRL
jgi:hypothetical protein